VLALQGCASRQKTVSKTTDNRPCAANLSSTGSFFSSRTFKTYQEFPRVSKATAFNRIVPSFASGGWTISSSSKATGVVTSWAKPNYAQGETESLNAVIRKNGRSGIRVELTYIAPAMSFVPKDTLLDTFCSMLADVKGNN